MVTPVVCKKCKRVMRNQIDDRSAPEYYLGVTEFNAAHVLGHHLIEYDLCESCWQKVKTFIGTQ